MVVAVCAAFQLLLFLFDANNTYRILGSCSIINESNGHVYVIAKAPVSVWDVVAG